MKSSKLSLSFFQQETIKVAETLLGCVLVRVTDQGHQLKGRIVETEAYLGLKDDSCHSFGGKKTKRTQTMFLLGGHAYIYFTYGMHYCFNIVTAGLNEPEAVLIRALEPLKGLKEMQKNRPQATSVFQLTNGPGKICQALNIDTSLNGEKLNGKSLYVEKGPKPPIKEIEVSARIGLSPIKSSCYWPLRFFIKPNWRKNSCD